MAKNTSLRNDLKFKVASSPFCSRTNEEKCIEELISENIVELKIILSKLNNENPISSTLFKEKYQVLLLKNLIPWQKPLGEVFQNSIVFCYAKPRKFSEPSSFENEVFSDEEGCPLLLQFDEIVSHCSSTQSHTHSLVKKFSEKHHLLPLSENIGRRILYMYNSIDSRSIQNLPVIVVCHGKNAKSAVLLGSWKGNSTRLILTNQGLVAKQEQLPRLSSIKEAHLQGFPPSFTTVDTSVFAHYDFLECVSNQNSALNPVKDSSVIMECRWTDASAILEPLTAACTCFVKIKAVRGNPVTGAFSLFKEVQCIEALQKCYETGMITWPNAKCDLDVMQSVKSFINEQKTSLSKRDKSPAFNSDPGDFDQAILSDRSNLDFTEKLWTILKDCSSFDELQAAFSFIYNALGEFFIPPYVFPKSLSTMAKDIKNIMEKSVVCPVMTKKLAIQLLLEIGVEKLRQDYITLFLSLGLIPLESISYFVEPDLLSLNAVICLKKLHSVLELTIVCEKQLSLSKTLLSEFVRSTLKHYTTVPDLDLSHVFSFQIPAIKARQLLNPMRPTVWEISLLSEINGFLKQSIHRYVTTASHEHIYAPDNYHPKLMLKSASYTYLVATLIQDDVFEY